MTASVILWARGPQDVEGAIAVRRRVFCDEQGVPVEEEVDGLDDRALHLVALDDAGSVVATLRLLYDGDTVKVGRVAVERAWRGRGIASAMLEEALAQAVRDGARRARLSSQVEVVALYERAGFVVESGVFEEAGIPHVWMSRPLLPAP
jgi:predicted GNAT family N-acyltransferase